MTHRARALSSGLAAAAALLVISAPAIAGCGGSPVAPAAGATTNGQTRPAVSSTRAVHQTGHLCADAAKANSSIRALSEAVILHHGGHQQVTRLLHTLVAAYTALALEAPAPVKGALAALASYYQSVEAKISGGGQLTLSDIEPAADPGAATAVRQASRYFLTHCAS